MNNVSLVGRLTRDPEVRYTDGGSSLARFSIAVDRRFKKEGQPDADFPSCVAFGKTAEFIEKYFRQGQRIGLTGRIQTGSYTNNDGVKIYTTDVVVESAEFVESKGSGSQDNTNQPEPLTDEDGFMNIPDGIDDDELPFN
nr:single-stranded DNA-binding protein [uncultured Anaerocolumna sp.]